MGDKANKIGSVSRLGFTLVDQARLQTIVDEAETAVGVVGSEWDGSALATVEPKLVAYALEVVARQTWRLEQVEPELFGAHAIVFVEHERSDEPQTTETADK